MSFLTTFLTTTNISYHIVPLVFLQTIYSSVRGPLIRLKVDNNVYPRGGLDAMEKSGKYSPRLIAKLRRRQGAHANCYEALGIFCASVVAGNHAGLSTRYMNIMSIIFFLDRCFYIWAYINIETRRASFLRSIAYWIGNFCYLTTFIKAGNALNASKI